MLLSENFDSYPAMTESEYVTAAGVDLAGNWQTTAIAEWGYDNQAKAGIVANPSGDGNVLMLEARAAYDGQAIKPAVTYKNLVFTSGDKYNYKYDFYRTNSNAGGGIRFNFKDDNYYALDFVGEWDHSYEYGSETTYSTALLKNGVRVKTVNEDASGVSIVNPENDAVSGYNLYSLGVNVWYTVDITAQDGSISWMVTDKSSNKVVQTGSYEDPEPLTCQGASVQIFAGGQGNEFMYFDNIEITKTKAGMLLYDEFDSYSAMTESEYVTSANVNLAGKWQTTTLSDWGYDGAAKAGIVANPSGSGNVLMLEARAAYDAQTMKPAVTYNGLVLTSGTKYNYKYDFFRTTNDAGGGIRFNLKDGSYYALDFVGTGDHSYEYGSGTTYSTALLKNGVRVKTVNEDASGVSIVNPESDAVSGYNLYSLGVNVWYTVDITAKDGSISWMVTDKSSNKVVQTGSYEDPEPLIHNVSSIQLFAGGQGNQFMYFDNIEITEIKTNALLYDEFDSYSAMTESEYVTAANVNLAGKWQTTTLSDWGYDGAAKAGIVANPSGSGNVLMLEARAAYDGQDIKPAVTYNGLVLTSGNKYNYKYDFFRTTDQAGGGIRFNLKDGSYYALDFVGNYDHSYEYGSETTYSTALLKNGVRVKTVNEDASGVSIVNPESDAVSGYNLYSLGTNVWYTVDITAKDGSISWTVTDKSSNKVVQTGSYEDPEPLIHNVSSIQLFAGGQGNQFMYFDNVSCTLAEDIAEYAITACDGTTAQINAPEANTTADIIFAAYNSDGILTSVSYEKANLTAGNNSVNAKTDFAVPSAGEVKVFLWEDMTPLCPNYTYTVQP